jgi:hypothetical protein
MNAAFLSEAFIRVDSGAKMRLETQRRKILLARRRFQCDYYFVI